jgi:hypothetical protein
MINPSDEKPVMVDFDGSPEEVAVGPDHVWATTGSGGGLVQITP